MRIVETEAEGEDWFIWVYLKNGR